MKIEVKLPDLGEGIECGDVLDVLVDRDEQISKGQDIIDLETDKATVAVPSSHGGRVTMIHACRGKTLHVGDTILILESSPDGTGGEKPAATAAPPVEVGPPKVAVEPPPQSTEPTRTAEPSKAATAQSSGAQVEKAKVQEAKATPAPVTAPPAGRSQVIPAGPSIRRFAREVGVDLTTVAGSGPGGRITRDDVLQVVRHANHAAQALRQEGTSAGPKETDTWGPIRRETASRVRRTIAAKMAESWSTVPRVTNFDDADVTELEKIRASSKKDYASKGIKLTAMPFVIKAVSMALKEHPLMNSSLDLEAGEVIYKEYINIGVAVDTDRGLVVPALRGADDMSIAEIARELGKLAVKSRDNDFSVDDLRGGTFTISNLGAIGGTYSTPILNVPEVGILLVGRSRKMPIVVDDDVAIRLMMPLSLSYDHRLVDGATAARFLNDVIGYLHAPGRLLLAP
ncbi:MAG: 2-oxo acid dehydrogenase subunit E2 [Planctomycetales bacterium]|nr:2-oxo acid dehydrogenase subunit E2 [Planctomycetales bacterium]